MCEKHIAFSPSLILETAKPFGILFYSKTTDPEADTQHETFQLNS